MKAIRAVAAALMVAALSAGLMPGTSGAQAPDHEVTVAVTVQRIVGLDCMDTTLGGCGSPPDFYARVHIGDLTQDTEDQVDSDENDISPNWRFERRVPLTTGRIPVVIRVRDSDGVFRGPADQVDIKDGPGRDLELMVNLAPCLVSGDLTARCPEGDISTGTLTTSGTESIKARLEFKVEVVDADSDGDALLDGWEIRGMDMNGDGTVDLPLGEAPYNANPRRKDLFVEVDYMDCAAGGCGSGDTHSHKPVEGVLGDVVAAFAAAPVTNPGGPDGITLHPMLDEAIPEVVDVLFETNGSGAMDDFNDLKNGNVPGPCTGRFGTAAERGSGNCEFLLKAKREVFQYAVFGHSYKEKPGSSGISELNTKGGNDFMVTLGNFGAAGISAWGGQRSAEAGTFMHEYGHNLGLFHGGFENKNCKPNYLSVMSYSLQAPNIDNARPLDYSADELAKLDETELKEPVGVGGPAGRLAVFGRGGATQTGPANGPIDWNGKNGDQETDAQGDVDYLSTVGDCDKASLGDKEIKGHDDWANLVYAFRHSPEFADGASRTVPSEMTRDELVRMTPLADLAVTKTVDRADATPGDTLAYTVIGRNLGPGKAIGSTIIDTLPDGVSQQRIVGELAADASRTENFSYWVPCETKDGAVLTNRARITGTNMALAADPNPVNNTDSASTTVHAPQLTLTKTATESANAGEKITYAVTFENVGSGAAHQVEVTDTLPREVYYSEALDAGTGPRPTAVIRNADGTTTLKWAIGTVSGDSGPRTIEYTARGSLLMLGGSTIDNVASVVFRNENDCVYPAVTATARSTVTEVAPTRDPLTIGYWRTHPEQWTSEFLARIQATDVRFDGADGSAPDGVLTSSEVVAAFSGAGTMPTVTEWQLLGTYLNLATRRITASTLIESRTTNRLGLVNVRDAGLFAQATLGMPYNRQTQDRYSDITTVLDEINRNRGLGY